MSHVCSDSHWRKAYRVEEGDVVKIEKIDGERGGELTFDDVLLVGNDDETHVVPTVAGASVSGTILEQDRDKKIVVFKFRRRKNYIRGKDIGRRTRESVSAESRPDKARGAHHGT